MISCSKENALIFDTTCISLVKQFDVSSYKIITMTQSFVFLIQPVSNYWWCHGLITGKGKDSKKGAIPLSTYASWNKKKERKRDKGQAVVWYVLRHEDSQKNIWVGK